MTKNHGEGPEKFVPLRLTRHGFIDQATENPVGIQKYFDDPDYARMMIKSNDQPFDICWATDRTALDTLDVLEEFIQSSQFDRGIIDLQHTYRRPGHVIGGANRLEADVEDIINEVHDSPERTSHVTLSGPDLELQWSPSWPVTFHDIPTNEILLRFKRERHISRFAIDHCMSLTALDGLRNAIDITLDEFAEYESDLKL